MNMSNDLMVSKKQSSSIGLKLDQLAEIERSENLFSLGLDETSPIKLWMRKK